MIGKTAKVKEIREKYEEGEINAFEVLSPRSHDHLHSPTRLEDMKGKEYVQISSLEKVLWKWDLDDRVEFLVGSQGTRKLLVKNTKVRFEEV